MVDRLATERLCLRGWSDEDLAPFAEMNADPVVMEHFPAPLTPAESHGLAARIEAAFARDGYGLWAVEERETGRFCGFTGLAPAPFDAHFTPAVEVGWRLARWSWGRGYATEAARAALAVGFEQAGLEEIVSFTSTSNVRSQRVMQKLGMTRDEADDFDHPNLPVGHQLQRHVLYRIRRERWRAAMQGPPPDA